VKGRYAGASRGEVEALTGVADPYEPPLTPELRLETVERTVDQNAAAIVSYLEEKGTL
jgi:bifunctional enzyme CysN/CysC